MGRSPPSNASSLRSAQPILALLHHTAAGTFPSCTAANRAAPTTSDVRAAPLSSSAAYRSLSCDSVQRTRAAICTGGTPSPDNRSTVARDDFVGVCSSGAAATCGAARRGIAVGGIMRRLYCTCRVWVRVAGKRRSAQRKRYGWRFFTILYVWQENAPKRSKAHFSCGRQPWPTLRHFRPGGSRARWGGSKKWLTERFINF